MLSRTHAAVLASLLVFATADGNEHELQWQQSDEGVLITEDGDNVLFYQRAEKSMDGNYTRAHYVHPLYDLDGSVLTEDFPEDHRHHRGVFWAWHQLRVGSEVLGDGWALSDLQWDVRELIPTRNQDGSITLEMCVDWKSPLWRDGKDAVVVENTTLRVYPREQDLRCVDFDIQIRAANEETFLGGSDDDKGYGGFSVRIKLPSDIQFTGAGGVVTPQTTAVQPSSWMSMSGSLGDPAADRPAGSGLTVLCHPESAGYPQSWILRSKRSMQNPVWPGRQPYLLSIDQPVTLRYRLVVHRDTVSRDVIEAWQDTYARQP